MKRSRLLQQREQAARRLVKRLERLDLHTLLTEVRAPSRARFVDTRSWHAALSDRLGARAAKLGAAVDHASGVYLPNRLHKVRIHLKRLRYLAEIAADTGMWRPARLRRHAARVQDALGHIHDRQVMLDLLDSTDTEATVTAALRADIAQRHHDYLTQRDRLLAIAEACRHFVDQRGFWRRRMSTAAVALLLPAASVAILVPTIGTAGGTILPDERQAD